MFNVDEHANFPFSAVTYVEATFPDGTRVSGAGAVVGVNDVLTAAHLVYSPENGGLAEQVTVYPGHDGRIDPADGYLAGYAEYYQLEPAESGKLTIQESQDDLALLGFDTSLGLETGWFALGPYAAGETYHVAGYPGQYADANGPRLSQDSGWVGDNARYGVLDIESLDIGPGSSGGPVWYDDNGQPVLVGVVSTSAWAVSVQAQYETLQAWIAGNDHLLPPEVSNSAVPDEADGALATFMARLAAEGWELPSELSEEIVQTETFFAYADLESVIDPVVRLYTGMLGRAPDREGAEYWVGQLNGGHSLLDLAEGFLTSSEFALQLAQRGGGDAALVETLYQHVLDRAPDPQGLDYWLGELESGRLEPVDLVLAFTASDEYATSSHSLVQGAKLMLWGTNLERLDPAGLGFDVASFESARESAEAVVRLYSGMLDRMPDSEGFAYWRGELEEGVSLTDIAGAFFMSDEFLGGMLEPTAEKAIEALYQSVLDRAPDEPGYAYWLAEMQGGDFGFGDLALSFTESAEFIDASRGRVDDYMLEHYHGGLVGEPLPLDEYLFG
ncbi:DUF4214 domain-containing protein [Halomonas campisalis]|uniref:Serine protease n=1 Tax=Billgrantia campisalis TaxID=74661 RepID=A0ABS9PE92_9GAMM|nr:DUF4214 domain-containing protein [Halomonas campisalis]MCG6659759.1 DUF4214 domain-containing protein [Halomonas campisalis]MDR5864915.1 DUF4214 domain-containing protein [Halomonas campisalis]